MAACEGEKIDDGTVVIVQKSVDGMSGLFLGELNFAVRLDTLLEERLGSLLSTLFGLRKDAGSSASWFAMYTLGDVSFHSELSCLSRLRILQITLKFASLPKPKAENAVFFCKCDLRWEEETVDEISPSCFTGDREETFGSRYGGGDLMLSLSSCNYVEPKIVMLLII